MKTDMMHVMRNFLINSVNFGIMCPAIRITRLMVIGIMILY